LDELVCVVDGIATLDATLLDKGRQVERRKVHERSLGQRCKVFTLHLVFKLEELLGAAVVKE
jgi:hypothetical protein